MPFNPLIPAAYPGDALALEAAWREFAGVVETTLAALEAKDDDEILDVLAADGDLIGRINARDVKRKFANITWSLSLTDAADGGVGEVASTFAHPGDLDSWTEARAHVRVDGFLGYAAWHARGLHYLALHETAHVTALGLRTWWSCWQRFRQTGQPPTAYASSEEWTFNEQVANQIAKVVGDWIGVDEIPNPSEGFPGSCDHMGLQDV